MSSQDGSGIASLQREQALFEQCHAMSGAERSAFLDDLATREPEIAERIRRLLAAGEVATALDDSPVHRLKTQPEFIGPYRVLQRLAEGGMGEVYVAEQLKPVRRRVAIKIVKLGMDTREVIARFESERQLLALMNHPNIARILDAGATESGRPYFVMEYVPGIPLLKYCDENRLAVEERLRLFVQVCQAVQHAHQKGIIHRDLKPSNILVMEQDGRAQPKVIDFGIAKATTQRMAGDTLHTRIGNLLGTPEYMSPEQAEVSPLDVDTRTDVYSLGVVLYELLSGGVPLKFSADEAYQSLRERIRGEIPPVLGSRLDPHSEDSRRIALCRSSQPAVLRRELRGELNSITGMAMAKEPGRRYSSVEAFMLDVQRYLDGEPVAAKAGQRFYRAGKFVQRHRTGIAALTTAFLAVLSVALGMSWQARQIAFERDRANQEAETANQVADFLGDVFQQADPYNAKGKELTAIEVLEQGVAKLEETMPQPTLARVRLLRILGRVHVNLGRYEAALPLLRRAYEDSLALFGADSEEALLSQAQYGRALSYVQAPNAENVISDNLERLRRIKGARHIETLKMINNLASVYLGAAEYARAEPLLIEASTGFADVLGEDDSTTILCKANLAFSQFHQGRKKEALALLERVVSKLDASLGEMHPHTLGLTGNLGAWYADFGRYDEADALFRRVYERQLRVLGKDHQNTITTMTQIAGLHHLRGEPDAALEFQQQAVEAYERIYGARNIRTLIARLRYAEFLMATDIDSALELARDLRITAAGLQGQVNEVSADAARLEARAHLRLGNRTSALKMLERAMAHGDTREMLLEDPELGPLLN